MNGRVCASPLLQRNGGRAQTPFVYVRGGPEKSDFFRKVGLLASPRGREKTAPAFNPRRVSRNRPGMHGACRLLEGCESILQPLGGKPWGRTTRNPLLLFRLSGLFLFRLAQRTFDALLLNEPPRNTRPFSLSPQHRPEDRILPLQLPSYPVTRSQPPSRRPNSATRRLLCSYCPPFSQRQWWARRR